MDYTRKDLHIGLRLKVKVGGKQYQLDQIRSENCTIKNLDGSLANESYPIDSLLHGLNNGAFILTVETAGFLYEVTDK